MRLFFLILACTVLCRGYADSWATKTLEQMTVDEKIAQLFMVAGYVDLNFSELETKKRDLLAQTDSFISQYGIGGIGLVGPSSSVLQVAFCNRYQQRAKYPILIAQDLEWGLSMRLTDGFRFPKNSTLGAVRDDQLIYEMGREIARQGRLVGVHMNLSPVLDININPENPVINVRSFGGSPQNVATKGIAMIRGLRDGSMIASAKHFPGLGDISVDPHLDLPSNTHDSKRLETVELYPFEKAIAAGVQSIQTEHVSMPALEPDATIPASLSPRIVQNLLKDKMKFQGLVISGALRMEALTKYFSQEEIAVKAFLAGNDMLLMPQDLIVAFHAIRQALQEGKIHIEQIDERVLKILKLKEQVGLEKKRLVEVPTLELLHTDEAKALKYKLYDQAISVVRDENAHLPIKQARGQAAALVQIGDASSSVFLDAVKEQLNIDQIMLPLDFDASSEQVALLEKYPLIILSVFPADPRRIAQIRLLNKERQIEELSQFRVHGLPKGIVDFVSQLKRLHKKTVVCYFGNPFGLEFFSDFSTLIMGYEDDEIAQQVVGKLAFSS
ncbi:MAG: hypothetical protein JSR46_10410 [Verrucomicrobia bacterium]|nr:hypothetical protein [Verrucomicrobiota bacterium]